MEQGVNGLCKPHIRGDEQAEVLRQNAGIFSLVEGFRIDVDDLTHDLLSPAQASFVPGQSE